MLARPRFHTDDAVLQYHENGAGRRPVSLAYKTVDPFWPDGSVIPHVYTEPAPVTLGQADSRIEVYDFRLW